MKRWLSKRQGVAPVAGVGGASTAWELAQARAGQGRAGVSDRLGDIEASPSWDAS